MVVCERKSGEQGTTFMGQKQGSTMMYILQDQVSLHAAYWGNQWDIYTKYCGYHYHGVYPSISDLNELGDILVGGENG